MCKIVLFGTQACVLETSEITGDDFLCKTGGRTNIIKGMNKLFEIIGSDTITCQKSNIIFITDGCDNCNENFNDIFKHTMGSVHTNHLIQ